MEILGDSVLSLLATEFIYKKYPQYSEGKISRIKSILVSESILAEIAEEIEISKILLLGKGETETGGAYKKSNLANAMEAFLGAFFLDSNLDTLRNWFTPYVEKYVIELENKQNNYKDSKTRLQEYAQKIYKTIPTYTILSEEGPAHEKFYRVMVNLGNLRTVGSGNSKKKAEKEAAKKLWDLINTRSLRKN